MFIVTFCCLVIVCLVGERRYLRSVDSCCNCSLLLCRQTRRLFSQRSLFSSFLSFSMSACCARAHQFGILLHVLFLPPPFTDVSCPSFSRTITPFLLTCSFCVESHFYSLSFIVGCAVLCSLDSLFAQALYSEAEDQALSPRPIRRCFWLKLLVWTWPLYPILLCSFQIQSPPSSHAKRMLLSNQSGFCQRYI